MRSRSAFFIAGQQQVLATATVAVMLLFLPSCRIPCLRGAQPGPALPPDYNGTSSEESSACLSIDEFFQDPVLTQIITEAVACNQELKILEEEIQIAQAEVLGRRGAYLPIASLRNGAGLDRHSLFTPLGAAERQLEYLPGSHFPDPTPNFRISADLFWQVDIWRELRNARDAAIFRYNAAIEKRNFFVTRLVAEIAENYFELMALDERLQILNRIIGLQEQSLKASEANKEAGRGTELAVQRFQAEVRKNQSELLIVQQEIVQAENRINFLRARFPQPVERVTGNFLELELRPLSVGIPAQLLQYRTDIRQAENELQAAGLDVLVARARFFPRLDLSASIGYEAFDTRYLFDPEALIGSIAGELVTPLINRKALQADYMGANARQLQAIYDYQRVVLNAFTEVVNNLARAENYRQSVNLKKEQLDALETSVDVATKLFQSARADYVDVLFSQRDLLDAKTLLVQTKQQQLAAMVNAYQALGGGVLLIVDENPDGLLDCPPE